MVNMNIIMTSIEMTSTTEKILKYEGDLDRFKSLVANNYDHVDDATRKLITEKYTTMLMASFTTFIGKYKTLTLVPNKYNLDDIKNVSRSIWYCNLTFELIPELQKFNSEFDEKYIINKLKNFIEENGYPSSDDDYPDNHDDYPDNHEDIEHVDESDALKMLKDLYTKGYNNFHAFPCGHCYINIYALFAIYDYLNDSWDGIDLRKKHEKDGNLDLCVKELLSNSFNHCNKCKLNKTPTTSTYMYANFRPFASYQTFGYVNPKYLGAMSNKLKIGDMVHTNNVNKSCNIIYIYEGNSMYLRIPRKWHYFVLPLKYAKLRGYSYYLNNCGYFDTLLLNDKLMITKGNDGSWEFRDYISNIISNNKDEYIFHDNSAYEASLPNGHELCIIDRSRKRYETSITHIDSNKYKIDVHLDGVIISEKSLIANKEGDHYVLNEMPNMAKIGNALAIFSKLIFKVKIYDNEHLIFGDRYETKIIDDQNHELFHFYPRGCSYPDRFWD